MKNNVSMLWKPIPLSLKILLIIFSLDLLLSLLYGWTNLYFLFGFQLSGIPAVLAKGLLNVVGIVILIYAIVKRLKWTIKYSLIYFGFFILNSILALISVLNKISTVPTLNYLKNPVIISVAIAIFLNITFLLILVRNKTYFEGK